MNKITVCEHGKRALIPFLPSPNLGLQLPSGRYLSVPKNLPLLKNLSAESTVDEREDALTDVGYYFYEVELALRWMLHVPAYWELLDAECLLDGLEHLSNRLDAMMRILRIEPQKSTRRG
jgi:hypothetical protein